MSKRSMDFDVLLQAYPQKPGQVIEEILRSTYPFTLALADLILRDMETAQETTREVYHHTIKNLEAYPTGTNLEGWIAAVAVRFCRKKIRSRLLPGVFGLRFKVWPWREKPASPPALGLPEKVPDSEISAAIRALPEGLRVPLFFHLSQKFSRAEISQILNTSEAQIERRIRQAIQDLTPVLSQADRMQEPGSVEMNLSTAFDALTRVEPLEQGVAERLEALVREIVSQLDVGQTTKRSLKQLKEVGWTLGVITLVLTVGWFLSRRVPVARPEPLESPAATPVPAPVEEERSFLFLEEDQSGDSSQGTVEPEGSWEPVVSADGRWVVFSSSVRNLVPEDHNGLVDIFIYDRETETIERVNVATGGQEADRNSFQPAVSGDARYVVYTSTATNLDPRDVQICGEGDVDYNCFDVFLWDRQTGETRMISVNLEGEPADNISVSPAISADGGWVAYWSMADNLVPNDSEMCGTGEYLYNCLDIFLHSLQTGVTERIPIGRTIGERENPFTPLQLSADGSRLLTTVRSSDRIAASLELENDLDVYVLDRVAGTWTPANLSRDQTPGNAPSQAASMSGDGRYVAFASGATNLIPQDNNRHVDVFLRNLDNGYTERISEVRSGEESDGDSGAIEAGIRQDWIIESLQISQDARWLLFISKASNLSRDVVFNCSSTPSLPGESFFFCYHLFLHDRLTRFTYHVYGPIYNFTPYASISADGRWVTFLGDSTDCYSRGLCTDIFLYDRLDQSLLSLGVATGDEGAFIASTSDFPRWSFIDVLRGHRGWVSGLAFTPDGAQLASAAFDRTVRLQSVPYGVPTLVLDDLESAVNVVASDVNGNVLAIGTMDGVVSLWQLPGGRLRGAIEGLGGAVLALDYSADGKYLAIGAARKVTLYLAEHVAKVDELVYPRGTVAGLDFSPDGRFLAVGNSDRTVWVHRVADGEVVLRLGSHTREVTSVAFSPDGKYLASGSADRTVNVWELSSGPGDSLSASLYKTFSHFDWVSSIAFSPDSRTLISGSYDGAVRVWTLLAWEGGSELLFRRPQDQIRSLSITSDGRYLAAGTSRGEIYLWQAIPEGEGGGG